MKKILSALVLAAVCLSGVSAKKSVKDQIDQVKIGKFKEVDIGGGFFRTEKTFGSDLIATEYTIKLYSDDGSVGIFYKTDLASKESLRFDREGRDAIRKAYELYLQDYEAKRLKKSKKFVEAYGCARAKVVWKVLSDSATAHPKVYFGYCFVGKSPYFCFKLKQAEAEQKKGDIVVRHVGTTIYFTRAQLKELVDGMSEAEIQKAYESVTAVPVLPEDTGYDEGEADAPEYEEASSDVEDEKVIKNKKDKKSKKEKKSKKDKKSKAAEPAEDESADYAEAI